MHFSTYIHGLRQGHSTKTLEPIVKRLTKLASSPLADLDDLVGAEVRVRGVTGAERLYGVVTVDASGVLWLRTIDGERSVLSGGAASPVVHH